jgi:hypothetical protein
VAGLKIDVIGQSSHVGLTARRSPAQLPPDGRLGS